MTLSLNGGNFKGFLMQAVDGNNNPIGSFNPPSNGKCLACGSNCDSITHTNSRNKNRVVTTWNAPSNYAGTAYFRYSIATSYSSYWAAVNGPSVTISWLDLLKTEIHLIMIYCISVCHNIWIWDQIWYGSNNSIGNLSKNYK